MARQNEAHSKLVHDARREVGNYPDVRLWPNNQGVATFESGAKVKYGLVKGSSDLIGIIKPSGRFLALEAKTGKAETTAEQDMFLSLIRDCGGFAAVFHDLEELRAAIERARNGERE